MINRRPSLSTYLSSFYYVCSPSVGETPHLAAYIIACYGNVRCFARISINERSIVWVFLSDNTFISGYAAEWVEASWRERKWPNFETVAKRIRTRATSIANPATEPPRSTVNMYEQSTYLGQRLIHGVYCDDAIGVDAEDEAG